MPYIQCMVFRNSGKYYGDENVFVKENTEDFNIPGQIFDNREIEDFVYVGKTIKYNVPFMVQGINNWRK